MPKRTVSEVAKANPVAMVGGLIVSVVAVAAAIETGFGVLDRTHVTHSELAAHDQSDQSHHLLAGALAEVERKSECRWLRDNIDRLRDQVRDMDTNGSDPAWIFEKRKRLSEYEAAYKDKKCNALGYI